MSKKSIAIDMDEVLADPIDKFIKLYQRDHQLNINLGDLHGKEIYQVVPEEISHKWREYANEKGFFRDLQLMPNCQEVVKQLTVNYEVYIVSAATEFRNSLEDKLDWLQDHFPFISWQHIMFCGNKIVNTDIMIDDRIKNFANYNGRKILFSSPHNLLLTNYERANNWQEIAEMLL